MPDLPAKREELEARKHRAAQHYAQQYDEVGREFGWRAPAPALNQHPNDYRREVLRDLKKIYLNNHPLYKIQMRGLPDDILPQFETDVLTAVKTEAYNPKNVPLGTLKKIERLDGYGKLKETVFVGQESFVKLMPTYRPGRRVVRFLAPTDTQGRTLRSINEYGGMVA
jgi:hypothetical protein